MTFFLASLTPTSETTMAFDEKMITSAVDSLGQKAQVSDIGYFPFALRSLLLMAQRTLVPMPSTISNIPRVVFSSSHNRRTIRTTLLISRGCRSTSSCQRWRIGLFSGQLILSLWYPRPNAVSNNLRDLVSLTLPRITMSHLNNLPTQSTDPS